MRAVLLCAVLGALVAAAPDWSPVTTLLAQQIANQSFPGQPRSIGLFSQRLTAANLQAVWR
jgi:hypothetical protein